GSPWMAPAEGLLDNRLLRGGSWFSVPHFCRSACRYSYSPAYLNNDVGFRVCSLPPGLPSWPSNP
ncbi:MAG: SUMF1/EgtB/PvdO family nonheme iron enzyme, partial [Cyanobacteriota bacterium]